MTSFQQAWHVGRAVQEAAPPRRKGTIKQVKGVGQNAVVVVNLKGHPPQSFKPAQLILL